PLLMSVRAPNSKGGDEHEEPTAEEQRRETVEQSEDAFVKTPPGKRQPEVVSIDVSMERIVDPPNLQDRQEHGSAMLEIDTGMFGHGPPPRMLQFFILRRRMGDEEIGAVN